MWGRLGSRADKPSSDPQDSAGLVCVCVGGACANSLTSPHALTDPNASCSRLHRPPCCSLHMPGALPPLGLCARSLGPECGSRRFCRPHTSHDRSPPLAYPCGLGSPRHSQVQCEASGPLTSPAQCLPLWYWARLPPATRPAPWRQCVLRFAQYQADKMNDHRTGCCGSDVTPPTEAGAV